MNPNILSSAQKIKNRFCVPSLENGDRLTREEFSSSLRSDARGRHQQILGDLQKGFQIKKHKDFDRRFNKQ